MLQGSTCTLRTVRESDLPVYAAFTADVNNRGDYYLHYIISEQSIRQRYAEHGFWARDQGTLLIINNRDVIIGEIEFFKPVGYWNVYEIAYILFDPNERGKGIVTEATGMLVQWLFANRQINRLQLQIFTANTASRRVAEKCGFTHEGTSRGVVFHQGRHHDLEMYTIFRDDVIK